jgi:hypothetical protein
MDQKAQKSRKASGKKSETPNMPHLKKADTFLVFVVNPLKILENGRVTDVYFFFRFFLHVPTNRDRFRPHTTTPHHTRCSYGEHWFRRRRAIGRFSPNAKCRSDCLVG